ncbi:MAG: GNAT family N-acetyltransferase [Proteobacteria bacterium]|nr:GNAT family N-acetyltransferase [Pseudomonadota bacterium]
MQIVLAPSVEAFGAAEWNRLFPGEAEDWSYYRATERARMPGFQWRYIGVREQGQLRAAAPAFITPYPLDTTLKGSLRTVVGGLARAAPGLLRPRMLALGSPVGEVCHVGFAPDCGAHDKARLFGTILDACEAEAARRRVRLFAVKDLPDHDATAALHGTLLARGLRRQSGLATAALELPFADLDGYFASLSRATRRDLRRKWRVREQLRIERRSHLDGIREQVVGLYRQTLARADMRLEEIPAEWFENVLAGMSGRASCVCYWEGERLVAFNLVLEEGSRLIDKYIGMDYARARELNLYYVSWLENIRYAIERGLPVYQSGQGLAEEKRRMGCALQANSLWYRHRNRIVDRTMAIAERALGLREPALRRDCAA